MKLSLEELEKIDIWIDQELYDKGVEVGKYFFAAYGQEDKGMTQVRNLQNNAQLSTRFTQIENFVKKQIGKEDKGKGWLFKITNTTLGDLILQHFEFINNKAEELSNKNYEKRCKIRKQMIRAYVEALVAQFSYSKKIKQIY